MSISFFKLSILIFLLVIFIPAQIYAYSLQDLFKDLLNAPSGQEVLGGIFSWLFNISFQWGGYCGDGHCTTGENSYNCPVDCEGGGGGYWYCGDGMCDWTESAASCPVDCGGGNIIRACACLECVGGICTSVQHWDYECPCYDNCFIPGGQCATIRSCGCLQCVGGRCIMVNYWDYNCPCFQQCFLDFQCGWGGGGGGGQTTTTTRTTTTTTTQQLCTSGTYRCNGKNLERCTNGQWQFVQSCEYQCSNNQCVIPTTTTTSTTTTTITTTTTTTPPQPLGIKCELKDKKYECSISGTCNSGHWLLNNKEGSPLEVPLLLPIPGKAVFETVAEGKVDVTASCYNPKNLETISLSVVKTKTTITGKFESKSFECIKITTGYKCTLSYFNGLGENATVMFFASDQNELVVYSAGPYTADLEDGNVSMLFICSAFMPGNYTISWNAYKSSDTKFLNPINWSRYEENQKIVC